ncbi:MAG: N-acetylmuramoyl-L-alanine amidase [Hyphomicrobiaceae bacterium]
MMRLIENYSAALSCLLLILCALGITLTVHLEGRATWSGEAAPATWADAAKPNDIFTISGRNVAYWAKPDAVYSKYATRKRRKPIAVVVHHTSAKPVKSLVTYGHVRDANRGGASFGYHFYIGRDGNIVQGAPLSRRTNHIKFKTNKQRRETAKHLWSGNTIGVSLVGGCDPLMRPDWNAWRRCSEEFVTKPQLRAGLAVIRALQVKFGMKCNAVYGHGDLQFDRRSFEGLRLSRLARRVCIIEEGDELTDEEIAVTPPKSIAVTADGSKATQKPEKPLLTGG